MGRPAHYSRTGALAILVGLSIAAGGCAWDHDEDQACYLPDDPAYQHRSNFYLGSLSNWDEWDGPLHLLACIAYIFGPCVNR
jgi:hypothetical protein